MFGKILTDEQKEALVWDVERGAPNEIIPRPWQSCSCIGGWHYKTDIYNKGRYKSAETVIRLLADIVSKNGNLLLNIPLRADGTFDDKEAVVINGIGKWMNINKEAIFDTRPWTKFGEGPVADADIPLNDQGFNEGAYSNMDSKEIRFTTKGNLLYAILLAWPENDNIEIKSLSANDKKVKRVELLGHGKVPFTQTASGLKVTMPENKDYRTVPVLKIR